MKFKNIITSLLDVDRYKVTMSQFAYFYYRNVIVKYAFTNRTKNPEANKILIHLIPYILLELEKVRSMRFNFNELLHLQSKSIFKQKYLNALSTATLPEVKIFVNEGEGQLHIETEGEWYIAMFWETIILSVVSELYSRYVAFHKHYENWGSFKPELLHDTLSGLNNGGIEMIFAPYYEESLKRLDKKIESFKHHSSVKFFEFGTRRRFDTQNQRAVISKLAKAFHKPQFYGTSQFLGTSNELIAMENGWNAGGTIAHECFMVVAGLNASSTETLTASQWDLLRLWNQFYGYDLSIALTDTFGSDWFFQNCPEDIAQMYSFREDSSLNLYKYTEDVIALYQKYGIDHHDKVIVHSNGLDVNKVITQDSYSQGKIQKVYGIGTDLSCDVGNDYPHLSMVVKAVEANGNHLVKLSDNLAKAIGNKETIEKYKIAFGYVNEKSEAQIY